MRWPRWTATSDARFPICDDRHVEQLLVVAIFADVTAATLHSGITARASRDAKNMINIARRSRA